MDQLPLEINLGYNFLSDCDNLTPDPSVLADPPNFLFDVHDKPCSTSVTVIVCDYVLILRWSSSPDSDSSNSTGSSKLHDQEH